MNHDSLKFKIIFGDQRVGKSPYPIVFLNINVSQTTKQQED